MSKRERKSEERPFPHFHRPLRPTTCGQFSTVPWRHLDDREHSTWAHCATWGAEPTTVDHAFMSCWAHTPQHFQTPGLCWPGVCSPTLGERTHTWVGVDDNFALNELRGGKASLRQPRPEIHVSICELLEHIEEELRHLLALALCQVQNFADLAVTKAWGGEQVPGESPYPKGSHAGLQVPTTSSSLTAPLEVWDATCWRA